LRELAPVSWLKSIDGVEDSPIEHFDVRGLIEYAVLEERLNIAKPLDVNGSIATKPPSSDVGA
jgi:hypothetical protein